MLKAISRSAGALATAILFAAILSIGSWANLIQAPAGTAPPAFAGIANAAATTATGCWMLEACTTAIASAGTANVVKIRRASDNNTCIVPIGTAGSGFLDLTTQTPCTGSTTVTTWMNATTAFVDTWYDQSGNGYHCNQATSGSQPQFFLSGGPKTGGLPYVDFAVGGTSFHGLNCVTGPTVPQPLTIVSVSNRTNLLTTYSPVLGSGSDFNSCDYSNAPNSITAYFQLAASMAGTTDNSWHTLQCIANATSSILGIDGSFTTGLSAGTGSLGGGFLIGATAAGTNLAGFMYGVALFSTNLNSTQYNAVHSRMAANAGTP